MAGPNSPWPVKLGDYELWCVASLDDVDGGPPGMSGSYQTQDMTKTLTRRDVPIDLTDFRKGCGFLKRRDANDDGGLAWAEDGLTWLDGLMPSGRRLGIGNGLGAGMNIGGTTAVGTPIIDSRRFDGGRFCITSGSAGTSGRVIHFANDNPAGTISYSPALNAFGDETGSLRAGYYCTAMEVFADDDGVPSLYVFAYNDSIPATRVYQYQPAGWTESDAFTNIRIDKAVAPVWWEAVDGSTAQRMLVAYTSLAGGAPSTTGFISNGILQCPYGSDPMLEASYVTPIVLDPAQPISKLLAFPEFGLATTPSGVWTFNNVRSMNLTPYAQLGSSITDGRVAALYQGGVFWARGLGADFYDASIAFRRQDEPMEVGPMAYFQDYIPVGGQLTGAVPYGKWLAQSLYNHNNQTTYVGRAAPRALLGPGYEGPGPWAQYWAEHVLKPTAGVGQQITHLMVSSPVVTSGPLIQSRIVNLWMFTADEPFSAESNYNLFYAALPNDATSIAGQASAGTYAYTASARFVLTGQDAGDPLAVKYARRFDILGRNITSNQPMALYTRTNGSDAAAMADLADGTDWPLAGTASSGGDFAKILPSPAVSGRYLWLQILLTTNSTSAAGICDVVSTRVKVVRETLKTITLNVVLDRDYPLDGGVLSLEDQDATAAAIAAYQNVGPTAYVDETGTARTVLVEQGQRFVRRKVSLEPEQWRTILVCDLSEVA